MTRTSEEDTDVTVPMTVPDSGPNRGDIPSTDDDEDNDLTSGDGNHSGDGPDTDDLAIMIVTTNKPRPIEFQDDVFPLINRSINVIHLPTALPADSQTTGDSTTTSSTTTTTTTIPDTTITTRTTTTTTTAATEPSTAAEPSTTTKSPTSSPPLSPTQLSVDEGTSNTVIFYFYTLASRIG